MFLFKPDKALAAGYMLLVQTFAAIPALAVEPAPLEDAVLRQSTAPTDRHDQEPDQAALKTEPQATPEKPGAKPGELSQIVRTNEIELGTTTPELPFGMAIRPENDGQPRIAPGTNLIFSANISGPIPEGR